MHGQTAVGDARRHHRQLQGCRQQIALAYGGNQILALKPRFAKGGALPLRRRQQPGLAAGKGKVEFAAQPQPPRHGGDLLNGNPLRQIVEIHIAGAHDGFQHVQTAVTGAFPAMKIASAEAMFAGAEETLGRLDDIVFQGRQSHHQFEGGTGRILPLDGFVQKRRIRMCHEVLPFLPGNAGAETVGIIGRG